MARKTRLDAAQERFRETYGSIDRAGRQATNALFDGTLAETARRTLTAYALGQADTFFRKLGAETRLKSAYAGAGLLELARPQEYATVRTALDQLYSRTSRIPVSVESAAQIKAGGKRELGTDDVLAYHAGNVAHVMSEADLEKETGVPGKPAHRYVRAHEVAENMLMTSLGIERMDEDVHGRFEAMLLDLLPDYDQGAHRAALKLHAKRDRTDAFRRGVNKYYSLDEMVGGREE